MGLKLTAFVALMVEDENIIWPIIGAPLSEAYEELKGASSLQG